MQDYTGPAPAFPMPYSLEDYYIVALIRRPHIVEYADHNYYVRQNMLMFANPQTPYNWRSKNIQPAGAFCVFMEDFMKGYGNIKNYPLYQPGGTSIIDLTDEDVEQIMIPYNKMFTEIESDYIYKYDLWRNHLQSDKAEGNI